MLKGLMQQACAIIAIPIASKQTRNVVLRMYNCTDDIWITCILAMHPSMATSEP